MPPRRPVRRNNRFCVPLFTKQCTAELSHTTAIESNPTRAKDDADDTQLSDQLYLPQELWLKVFKYLPQPAELPLSIIRRNWKPREMAKFNNGINGPCALRQLTRVCKAFRAYALPLVWRRVYACSEGVSQLAHHREVISRCEALLSSANIAAHVQVFTVSLMRKKEEEILPLFANCLAALPHLHTLEMPYVSPKMSDTLGETFEGRAFPSVRRVVLPDCAHPILRACPEAREVVCIERDGENLVDAIVKGCKHVTSVDGITPLPGIMKQLAEAVPNLSVMILPWYPPVAVQSISVFKRLTRLEVGVSSTTMTAEDVAIWDAAQAVLRSSQANGPKTAVRAVYAMVVSGPDWDMHIDHVRGVDYTVIIDS